MLALTSNETIHVWAQSVFIEYVLTVFFSFMEETDTKLDKVVPFLDSHGRGMPFILLTANTAFG